MLRTIFGFVGDFRPLLFYSVPGISTLGMLVTGVAWRWPSAVMNFLGILSALFFGLGFYFNSHCRWQKLRLNKARSASLPPEKTKAEIKKAS